MKFLLTFYVSEQLWLERIPTDLHSQNLVLVAKLKKETQLLHWNGHMQSVLPCQYILWFVHVATSHLFPSQAAKHNYSNIDRSSL